MSNRTLAAVPSTAAVTLTFARLSDLSTTVSAWRSASRDSYTSRLTGRHGPHVRSVGPQSQPCTSFSNSCLGREEEGELTQWYCAFRTARREMSPFQQPHLWSGYFSTSFQPRR